MTTLLPQWSARNVMSIEHTVQAGDERWNVLGLLKRSRAIASAACRGAVRLTNERDGRFGKWQEADFEFK